MQKKYFSELHQLSLNDEETWFDTRLDKDIKLYIDPFFVFRSEIPIFKNAEQKFFKFFQSAFQLAHEAQSSSTALKKLESILKFPEVMEIRLGDSKGDRGAGPGTRFAKACAKALVTLSKKGLKGLDHFEEIAIFTKGIGPDGISDATANILKYELIQYTQSICRDLEIPTKRFHIDHAQFDFQRIWWGPAVFSLPENPYLDNTGVLLVPKEFLSATHVISSDRFSAYISRNKIDELKASLNYEIEKSLSQSDIRPKSKDLAKSHPMWIREYVESVENDPNISPYDLEEDSDNLYRNEKKAYKFVSSNPYSLSASNDKEFLEVIEFILDQFRLYVEEQGGFKLLWNDIQKKSGSNTNERIPRDEDTAQCLFSGIIKSYCQANDIDVSREVETGRGPVDFKFSSGYRKRVLVELKLAKSSKLKQGRIKQLPTYLRSQQIKHGHYVVIVHRKKEFERIEKLSQEVCDIDFGDLSFKIHAVDATFDKPSASNL